MTIQEEIEGPTAGVPMSQEKSPEFLEPRRRDRAVEDADWIDQFLKRAPFAVFAVSEDGTPYAQANLFAYDPSRRVAFLHTARTGRLQSLAKGGVHVALVAAEMGHLVPAKRAIGFSVEYASVVAFGTMALVSGEEARRGLRLLMDKYASHLEPERDYEDVTTGDLRRTAVYRVRITGWSAKRNPGPAAEADIFPFRP